MQLDRVGPLPRAFLQVSKSNSRAVRRKPQPADRNNLIVNKAGIGFDPVRQFFAVERFAIGLGGTSYAKDRESRVSIPITTAQIVAGRGAVHFKCNRESVSHEPSSGNIGSS